MLFQNLIRNIYPPTPKMRPGRAKKWQVNIANYEAIEKFARKHARSRTSLNIWYETVSKSNWNKFDDVKKTLNATDIYQDCVIFDIAGNNFRLIAQIDYELQQVSVRAIMTHSEYVKDKWKKYC